MKLRRPSSTLGGERASKAIYGIILYQQPSSTKLVLGSESWLGSGSIYRY